MKKAFFVVCRVLLGSVFAVSGLMKLLQPSGQFLAAILSFEITGGFPARALAATLPWAEWVLGVFLILGLWSEWAALGLWALNSVFVVVLASVLARHLPIDHCGCFGEKFTLPVWGTLLLDLGIWGTFFLFHRYGLKSRCLSLDKLFTK